MTPPEEAALPIRLVPGRSDSEIAKEIKSNLTGLYGPICVELTRAKKLGFNVSIQTGATAFGEVIVTNLSVSKEY